MKVALLLLIAASACSDKPSSGTDAGGDAFVDGADDANDICQGQCKLTNVTLMFQTTRTVDTAYYGTMFDAPALRVEAYRKVGQGCPTASSTPDYIVILGEVDPNAPSSPMSTANIRDLKGDLLGGPLGLAATMRQIDRVAWVDKTYIAIDVMLTFSSGTAIGHIYATHCDTLDI